MARITINGVAVDAPERAPLVEVIKNAGFPISNLCYLDGLPAYAGCRTCAVEIEGMRGLPLSCTTQVADGMVVRTDTPAVTEMRQEVLAVILANHSDRCLTCHRVEHCRTGEICLRDNEVTHRCVTCSKNYRCELQTTCDAADVGRANVEPYIDEARTYYRHQQPEPDRANPFFEFDPQMCIICTRCVRACDDLRHTTAITLAGRGFTTRIAFGAGGQIDESNCDFCGACVDVCPTATLMEAPNKWVARPDKWTTTTCTECSMGCTIQMGVRDGRGVQVRPGNGNDVSRSQICVRGRFGYDQTRDKDRLRAASIGRGQDAFEQDGASVAADAAAKLNAVLAEHGPAAVGILGSGQSTTEELFALRTLARRIGVANLDSSLGPVTAAISSALCDAFGSEHLPSRLTAVETADLIVAIGDDISASNNVLGVRIKDAVANNGASLVSISARRNPLADYAVDEAHAVHPSDGDLAGVAQALAAGLLRDMDIRTSLSEVDGLSDVTAEPRDGLETAVATLARRRGGSAAVVVAPSRANAAQAEAQVRAAANLSVILAGPEAVPAALHILPPEANSVGLRDIGIAPAEGGLGVAQMLEAARAGNLKALLVARDNPMLLHPNQDATRAALEALDLLIVIDEVRTETVELATHVLPDISAFAKDGHITNADRQILRLRAAAAPQRNARAQADWLALLAAGLPAMDITIAAEDEDAEPTVIPAPAMPQNTAEAAAAIAAHDARYTALANPGATQSRQPTNGAASQRLLPVDATGATGDGLTVLTGRDLYTDRLSAARGAKDADLLHRAETLQINPADAAERGIAEGAEVSVANGEAELSLRAEITEDIPQGAVWLPLLHNQGSAHRLISHNHVTAVGIHAV